MGIFYLHLIPIFCTFEPLSRDSDFDKTSVSEVKKSEKGALYKMNTPTNEVLSSFLQSLIPENIASKIALADIEELTQMWQNCRSYRNGEYRLFQPMIIRRCKEVLAKVLPTLTTADEIEKLYKNRFDDCDHIFVAHYKEVIAEVISCQWLSERHMYNTEGALQKVIENRYDYLINRRLSKAAVKTDTFRNFLFHCRHRNGEKLIACYFSSLIKNCCSFQKIERIRSSTNKDTILEKIADSKYQFLLPDYLRRLKPSVKSLKRLEQIHLHCPINCQPMVEKKYQQFISVLKNLKMAVDYLKAVVHLENNTNPNYTKVIGKQNSKTLFDIIVNHCLELTSASTSWKELEKVAIDDCPVEVINHLRNTCYRNLVMEVPALEIVERWFQKPSYNLKGFWEVRYRQLLVEWLDPGRITKKSLEARFNRIKDVPGLKYIFVEVVDQLIHES